MIKLSFSIDLEVKLLKTIDSGCTVKSNTFEQSIKSPYLAQYKIFEERLKNPRLKTMSMIMRKRKIEDYLGK